MNDQDVISDGVIYFALAVPVLSIIAIVYLGYIVVLKYRKKSLPRFAKTCTTISVLFLVLVLLMGVG
jgi:heme A synthase